MSTRKLLTIATATSQRFVLAAKTALRATTTDSLPPSEWSGLTDRLLQVEVDVQFGFQPAELGLLFCAAFQFLATCPSRDCGPALYERANTFFAKAMNADWTLADALVLYQSRPFKHVLAGTVSLLRSFVYFAPPISLLSSPCLCLLRVFPNYSRANAPP